MKLFRRYIVFVAVVCIVFSCSGNKNPKIAKEANFPVKKECQFLYHQDSIVVEFLNMSLPYAAESDLEHVLYYYENASRMESSISGIALYAGNLNLLANQKDSARTYFVMEIEHDQKLLDNMKYECKHDIIYGHLQEAQSSLNKLDK